MTAAVTLYCDHVDGLLRPCLAQYTCMAGSPLEARLDAAARQGWASDGRHDLCITHAKETP